jgi:hypothetical protein
VEPAGSIEHVAAPGLERIQPLLSEEPIAADTVIVWLRAVSAGGVDAIRDARALEQPRAALLITTTDLQHRLWARPVHGDRQIPCDPSVFEQTQPA